MQDTLNLEILASLSIRVAVLSSGNYALPVRFRIREGTLECRVPIWSGVGDLLETAGGRDVTLVAARETGPYLHWFFIRGPATVVANPDWSGLEPPPNGRTGWDDLYQILRIVPRRIERIDESQGWGHRATADF